MMTASHFNLLQDLNVSPEVATKIKDRLGQFKTELMSELDALAKTPVLPAGHITGRYVIDTVQRVGYLTQEELGITNTGPYYEIPSFITHMSTRRKCSGWDIISGAILPGMDVILRTSPHPAFQMMPNLTNAHDLTENETFFRAYKQASSCPNCLSLLSILPSDLSKVCLICLINNDPASEAQRAEIYKLEKSVDALRNHFFKDLLIDDTPLNFLGPHHQPFQDGIFSSFLVSIGYDDELSFDDFQLFNDHGQEDLKKAIVAHFTQSMTGESLVRMSMFDAIELIKNFIDDLYSPQVVQTLLTGIPPEDIVSEGGEIEAEITLTANEILSEDLDADNVTITEVGEF